jgi:hypothetical protein
MVAFSGSYARTQVHESGVVPFEARDPQRAAAVRNDPDYNLLTAGLGFPTPPTPQLWTGPAEPGSDWC